MREGIDTLIGNLGVLPPPLIAKLGFSKVL